MLVVEVLLVLVFLVLGVDNIVGGGVGVGVAGGRVLDDGFNCANVGVGGW